MATKKKAARKGAKSTHKKIKRAMDPARLKRAVKVGDVIHMLERVGVKLRYLGTSAYSIETRAAVPTDTKHEIVIAFDETTGKLEGFFTREVMSKGLGEKVDEEVAKSKALRGKLDPNAPIVPEPAQFAGDMLERRNKMIARAGHLRGCASESAKLIDSGTLTPEQADAELSNNPPGQCDGCMAVAKYGAPVSTAGM